MRELRAVLDARLDPAERILCLSHFRAPRLYYLSGRWPCRPYLYFAFNLENRFSFADAVQMFVDRKVGAGVVEILDVRASQGTGEGLKP